MSVPSYDHEIEIYVKKRPFLQEFMETVAGKFELGIFTASRPDYAAKVIEKIDPKGCIRWSLYRNSCTLYEGYTIKNLEILPRPLDRTVLVDDRNTSFMFQRSNGIECLPFQGEMEDVELKTLERFLCHLSSVEGDIREYTGSWMDFRSSET